MSQPNSAALLTVLERARAVGFLGPGPLRVHTDHAEQYLRALPSVPTPGSRRLRLADLGSGGGLPGLPLFVWRPDLEGILLDASAKRCAFLTWAIVELGLQERVSVVLGRAEQEAHDRQYRLQFDAVVCRGFGPPAITVECGMAYVRMGGCLMISEPPETRNWPKAVLEGIGLRTRRRPGLMVMERHGSLPDELPRPHAQQRQRPLFVFSPAPKRST